MFRVRVRAIGLGELGLGLERRKEEWLTSIRESVRAAASHNL